MPSYRIELSISPLSPAETEHVLRALRHSWEQPAWIKRQQYGDACLLMIQHEITLSHGESPNWFCDRIAASIWRSIGRFARIALASNSEDGTEAQILIFEEADYWRLLKSFRLSPTFRQ